MEPLSETVNVIVPTGALGAGVREADLRAGLTMNPHAIACDAGSTDSGPAYLACAKPKYSRGAVKTDLRLLMLAQAEAGIPLLIGSCGTSGADAALDWTHDIAKEIAREEGLRPRIALLYSEQNLADLAIRIEADRVRPLAPVTDVDPARFRGCAHVVALMGAEPYIAALETGADIVLGGRTTDTAVIAAVPLIRGAGAGAAWHAGKIAECGGLCTVIPREGGVMIRVGTDAFEIVPLSDANRCTPRSVSAHMLYENADPFRLTEPGGILDVTQARYVATDERTVRVVGSRFEPMPYSMKLEGAGGGPFQTMMLVGIQAPDVLDDLDRFLDQMDRALRARVAAALPGIGDYHLSLRPYGWNAVSGAAPADAAPPAEIGLLFVATAATQDAATMLAKTCNPLFFHMPLDAQAELPSYAFPFSPAEIERGQVFEFRLNHVVFVDDPLELVRIEHHAAEEPFHA